MDDHLFVELKAEPLLDVPGRLVIPEDRPFQSLASVSARRIYTNVVRRFAVSDGGAFSLRLPRGDWKVNVENLSAGLTLKSITFGGKEIHDETITISNQEDSTLLLEITLQ